jgi:Acetyltransferase (GNAT) domain
MTIYFSESFNGPASSLVNAQYHFYLSQHWFETYLRIWEDSEKYGRLQCIQNNSEASVCWVSQSRQRSKLGFSYRKLALNESQAKKNSSITLEVNGFFSSTESFDNPELTGVLLKLNERNNWSEIRLANLNDSQHEQVESFADRSGMIFFDFSEQWSYSIDLEKIRAEKKSEYVLSRSSNSRAQMRSALRKCVSRLGSVTYEEAATQIEALAWLENLAELHISRWNKSRSSDVGFANPHFMDFYKTLTRHLFEQNMLRLAKITAGETTLGYLFNILYNNKLYFAISGINYEGTQEYKPGLLSHWFAIEQALKIGVAEYDFMVGTSQYKESLCTDKHRLRTVILRRPRLDFLIEHGLRKVKRAWNNQK